jgi:putative RNA 2'-phosphotransferase
VTSESHHRRLSKFLSLILRHEPEKFGLRLDAEGSVPLSELLAVVQRERGWERVTEEQIREVVATSDKQRFEITGDNIRARYGHSVPQPIAYAEVEPPEILYHGTSPQSLPAIRAMGLRSMRRQYVHLSTQVEQARAVGRRHSHAPVVLTVRAHAAWQAGVKFSRPEERLYLSPAIPAEFIEEESVPHAGKQDPDGPDG